MAEAAEILGVSVEAVRGRIQRGTIEHERTPEGLFVLLDTDQTTTERDQSTDQTRPDADQDTYRTVSATEFIQEMRGRASRTSGRSSPLRDAPTRRTGASSPR